MYRVPGLIAYTFIFHFLKRLRELFQKFFFREAQIQSVFFIISLFVELNSFLTDYFTFYRQLQATGSNQKVLEKIKEATISEPPRKASRIDIIDKARKLRSNSVFRRQSVLAKL